MIVRNPQRKKRLESAAVDLAIGAIDGRPDPLDDPEMARVNPDRVSLDLPEGDGCIAGGVRFDKSRSRQAVDGCIVCGQSRSDDCQ